MSLNHWDIAAAHSRPRRHRHGRSSFALASFLALGGQRAGFLSFVSRPSALSEAFTAQQGCDLAEGVSSRRTGVLSTGVGVLQWNSAPLAASAASTPPQQGLSVPGVGGREVFAKVARPSAEVSLALKGVRFPASWPFKADDFFRLDRETDSVFYEEPRFVKHVDDKALAALTAYYADVFPQGDFDALDFCSSWVSHYPEAPKPRRLAVSGMNRDELAGNKQATDFSVKDLNEDPTLPYGNEEFDVVTNVVSVDYLTKPREVFGEVSRVLRPGGLVIVSFSDRFFLSKVVAPWTSEDDAGRAEIVANYLHFAGGFRNITAVDITPAGVSPGGPDGRGRTGDPMYVVSALKA